jgi:hypothetical protein
MPTRIPTLPLVAAAALAVAVVFVRNCKRAPRRIGAQGVAYDAVDAPDATLNEREYHATAAHRERLH